MGMRGLASAVVLGLLVSAGTVRSADEIPPPPATQNAPAGPPQQAYGMIPPTSYNFYYPGQPSDQIPAVMYKSPLPVPPHVGYTYITYQPLQPHEFMHQHARLYVRYHPQGGMTTTRVRYGYHEYTPFYIRQFQNVHYWLHTR